MDLRPPIAAAFAAFSVPAVVTPPRAAPITTSVTWHEPDPEDQPAGTQLGVLEPERLMTLLRGEVPETPLGTIVVAPEEKGGVSKRWQVDAVVFARVDYYRVRVIPETNC